MAKEAIGNMVSFTSTPEPAPPARSLQQRLAALKKANCIRSRRAELKRDLAAGRTEIAMLLQDPACATMKVFDALIALPKVGRVKANRALMETRISPSKTLAGLSARQRRELLALLPTAAATLNVGGAEVTVKRPVAPIHSVPQPKHRGRRVRGLDDLLSDIERA